MNFNLLKTKILEFRAAKIILF